MVFNQYQLKLGFKHCRLKLFFYNVNWNFPDQHKNIFLG